MSNQLVTKKVDLLITDCVKNLIDVVILKSILQGDHGNNFCIVLKHLCFIKSHMVHLAIRQHHGKNHVGEQGHSSRVTDRDEGLETLKEGFKRWVPLLLTHVHLATAFFNDTGYTSLVNDTLVDLRLLIDLLHPTILPRINAHLNFKCEHLEHHTTTVHIILVRVFRVLEEVL